MNSSTFVSILVICCVSVVNSSRLICFGVECPDKKIIVDHHNDLRRQIAQGSVPGQPKASNMQLMVWDDKLAKIAQDYAKKMIFNHNPELKTTHRGVGENLFFSQNTSDKFQGYDWKKAIQMWFDEHKVYSYGSGFSMPTGHYTQVVWAETTRIGCGGSFYKEDNTKWFDLLYVCNYGPGGNMKGVNEPYKTGQGCENLCSENGSSKNKIYGSSC